MCGIAGYYSWTGIPLESGRIEAMTSTLRHRGPDDYGTYEVGGVSLGHTRLSIIDLSPAGRQPMANEHNDIWLVFNGEIYNFELLREDLIKKGHLFCSDTDSEVIIHQYEEDGERCVERLNGMFAFALWDRKNRKLFLARDRAGQKPLFYFVGQDFIIFGSEIKALLASGLIRPELNFEALQICMFYNAMAAPHTILKGVVQLEPGHCIACAQSSPRVRRFWDLKRLIGHGTRPQRKEGDWLEEFVWHFNRAVTMRMRSDAPFGAFLSGGLDSSAVIKAMVEVREEPVRTFAFGFRERSYDETGFAEEVASIFGTHHESIYSSEAELSDLVETVVYHGEEYTPNPCFIPVYLLSRGASRHVKMVLSGDGGDELLAGYETYQASYLARAYRRLPEGIRKGTRTLINQIPNSDGKVPLENKLKRFVYGAEQKGKHCHAVWRYIFSLEDLRQILRGSCRKLVEGYDPTAIYRSHLEDTESFSFLKSLLYSDFSYYLPNDALVKMDRMGMANALEIRNPFLDHELVEFAFQMPDHLRLRYFLVKKYILKKYLNGSIPRSLIYRKKAGFNVPVDAWLRGPLRTYMTDLLGSDRVRKSGIFEPSAVERLIRTHLTGQANHGLELWNLLCFSVWHGLFFGPAFSQSFSHKRLDT
jgi:asparagine synthase (glutamine-hydrolysing)